jgi:hypothetical protein
MQASRPLLVYSCTRIQTALSLSVLLGFNPVDTFCLGDDVYLEQVFGSTTDHFYGRYSDSISAPAGAGVGVTVGAAVNGALPAGAATVIAGGAGYPAAGAIGSLSGCTISAFFLPIGGLQPGQIPASGTITTDGTRAVVSANVYHGGTLYDNVGSATQMRVVASCNREYWPLKWAHQKAGAEWALLQAMRAAGMKLYCMFDDHELISNLTFASTDLTSRSGGGAPWWQSMSGQTNLLNFWREAVAGFGLTSALYYDNPTPQDNPTDIPAGLVGAPGVTPNDFKIRYHYVDYGAKMVRGGKLLRVMQFDTMSFKSPYNATDDGTGTSGKTMLGFTQMRWAIEKTKEAKALGMSVVWLMPKDPANFDNGDSWRGTGGGALGYNGEWNYLLGQIEALDLPVAAVLGGDRHQPHAAWFDIRNGDAGSLLTLCPCPLGADPAGMSPYPQNIYVNRDPDVCVAGLVSLLDDAVRVQIVDAHTGKEMFGADVPLGQRRPREIRCVSPDPQKPLTIPSVYAYEGTWALRPTSGIALNAKAYFRDIGPNGSVWSWDGTYWAPLQPVVLYRGSGNLANYLATLSAVSGTFVAPGSVPAGMFIKPGMCLEVDADLVRTTAIATSDLNVTLGGVIVETYTTTATASLHVRLNTNVWCRTSASQLAEGNTPPGGSGVSTFSDKTINFANAAAFALSLANASASDTHRLVTYSLILYP